MLYFKYICTQIVRNPHSPHRHTSKYNFEVDFVWHSGGQWSDFTTGICLALHAQNELVERPKAVLSFTSLNEYQLCASLAFIWSPSDEFKSAFPVSVSDKLEIFCSAENLWTITSITISLCISLLDTTHMHFQKAHCASSAIVGYGAPGAIWGGLVACSRALRQCPGGW